jgi:protein-S-isoprenylcysteine O-methyltransferase Ste14
MKFVSLLGYVIMVIGMVALWSIDALFASNPLVIALQVLAAALMIWARVTFGLRSFHPGANPTAGALITTGPYRFIRHPIYTAICVFVIAGALGNLSLASALFALLVVTGAIVRILLEERFLLGQYPDYAAYSVKTKRIIPWLY